MKVLIGGMFDILHSGHIQMFHLAKSFGDYLIVSISPDIRAEEKKGKGRPILSEKERKYIIKHIKCVDEVVCVPAESGMAEKEYQKKVIEKVKPDIFIRKSYDNEIDKFCKDRNIRLVVLPEIEGIDKLHSSGIINKIKESH